VSNVILKEIRRAQARIHGRVRRTPVLTDGRLDEVCGARIFLKCENLQHTGAFKARGALNAVLALDSATLGRGVATHSSGNHAAALAWAAGRLGVAAHVVMPRTAPDIKVASVQRLGGKITFCEPTLEAREAAAARVIEETGATLVHPYNDPMIIAGQGTVAMELLEEIPDLDVIVCPVGGGGLAAGTAVAARALAPGIRLFGAEPEGAADTRQSLRLGVRTPVANPASIADGLLAFVGSLTFPVIQAEFQGVDAVPDSETAAAVRRLLNVTSLVVEPSGAIAFAAASSGRLGIKGLRVGVILSGGNLDLDRAPWLAAS
jgi:threonine dehydratase